MPVVDWLRHISSHPEIETVHLVLLLIRCRQNHYRDTPEPVVALYHFQEFDAVHDGHVQIQQNDAGFIMGFVLEVVQSILAVFPVHDLVANVNLLESAGKKDEGLSVTLNRLIEAGGAGNGCRYPDEDIKRHSVAEETVHWAQVVSCVRVELPQKRARDLATLIQ